jgi:hypothetical protein
MQGDSVVLYQSSLRRQLIALYELRDRFRVACIRFFAIQ